MRTEGQHPIARCDLVHVGADGQHASDVAVSLQTWVGRAVMQRAQADVGGQFSPRRDCCNEGFAKNGGRVERRGIQHFMAESQLAWTGQDRHGRIDWGPLNSPARACAAHAG